MKKIVVAAILALTPMFTLAQSLGDKIELSVKGQLIEATIAERLPSNNSYRLTFEDAAGDTQHLGFLHERGENQLISLTHPAVGKVTIRRVDGETYIQTRNRKPSEPLKPKQVTEPARIQQEFQMAPRLSALRKANNTQITSRVTNFDDNIDVLFLYDDRLLGYAEENNYDLALSVEAAVATSNAIFERSLLPVEMSVAGVVVFRPESTVSFPAEDPNAVVEELVDDQRVARLVDRYQADVVHFIGADNPEVCGIAFIASEFNVSDNLVNYVSGVSGAGYTAISCTGSGTVAHEVGHNFGLMHDRYTLADDGSGGGGTQENYHIPYGYIEESGRFYTTMSYGSVCRSEFSEGSCIDEAVYSNPNLVDENFGLPLGKAASQINAANASKAAQRSSVVWANNASRTNLSGMAVSYSGNSQLTFSWPAVENAGSYALAAGRCEQYGTVSREQLLDMQSFNVNSVALSGIPDGETNLCIIAVEDLTDGAVRWRFVSNLSISGGFSDANPNYLLLDNNVMELVKAGDQTSFTIELSDAETNNSALQLAVPTTASGTAVSQGVGIDTASQWFDWAVSGTGSTRTMTVTLTTDIDEVAANLGQDSIYNPFHWRLQVINTNFSDFSVASGLWNDPSNLVGTRPQAFLSSGEMVGELTPLDAQISLFNVSSDVGVSVVNVSDDLISDFGFTEVSGGVDGERRFDLTGIAGIVDSSRQAELRLDFDDGSESLRVQLTVTPRAIAPTITEFSASGTSTEQSTRLTAGVIDADLNLNPDSLQLVQLKEDGSNVEVTGFSYTNGAFIASLGELAAGSYQYRLSVADTEGNSESATLRFNVTEAASSGSSGGHAGWLVLLGAAAVFVRRRAQLTFKR